MKMQRLLTLLFLSLMLISRGPAAMAAPAVPVAEWEHVDTPTSVSENSEAEHLEVTVHDGYIYVTTPRSVTVKVFTILGQLVSQAKLAAGSSRLKLTTRGIYILKAGSQTRRVTI